MIYKAKENERLDSIVYRHYGGLKHFELVLEINAKLGVKLKAGDRVILPEIKEKEEIKELKSLW
ncbi:phage tail protein X family protein [Campylobacter blaseri]|uniref:Phage tail protein n=1 Tax=Campylobacter blaseri TaxID=2042961 RepID=A0A2P8QYQ3_9BACT|nr:tail protein X [Campylobacter blaseri]PSM51375.1 phage tail protein [Campylobacter blaseri]PSM52825.1 phage tail protein [Campylobacter blaseri]QKF86126.1 phage tail protein X family protein [Campylobacter blaseri]